MRLIKTTEKFIYRGYPLIGIPLLVNKSGYPVSPFLNYMLYLIFERGRTQSPKTWTSHANSLYDYFSYLEAQDLEWDQQPQKTSGGKEISNLSMFSWWSQFHYRKQDGKGLQNSTINTRLSCIEGFYEWAKDISGLIEWLPYNARLVYLPLRNPGLLAHTQSRQLVESSELRLPEHKKPPKLLTIDKCKELMAAPMSRTIKLMTHLMLATGIRNEEVRTFPIKYIFNPRGLDPRKRIRVSLDPADMRLKGSKPRSIFLSWQLMASLYEYTCFGEGVERSNKYQDREGQKQTFLFLSKEGRPFAENGLSVFYNKLSHGYTKNGKHHPPSINFRATPHMLRHTFATLELYHEAEALDKKGRKKGLGHALSWVRDRLGHQSIHTTTIYVHCLQLLETTELNEYQEELDTMLKGLNP